LGHKVQQVLKVTEVEQVVLEIRHKDLVVRQVRLHKEDLDQQVIQYKVVVDPQETKDQQVITETRDQPPHKVIKVLKVLKVRKETKVSRELKGLHLKDQKDRKGLHLKDQKDLKVHHQLGRKVQQVLKVLEVEQAELVTQYKDLVGQQEHRLKVWVDLQVTLHKAVEDLQETKDRRVMVVIKDQQHQKVIKVLKVLKDLRVIKVLKVLRAHHQKVRKDHKVHRQRVQKDHKVHHQLDHKVQLVLKVTEVELEGLVIPLKELEDQQVRQLKVELDQPEIQLKVVEDQQDLQVQRVMVVIKDLLHLQGQKDQKDLLHLRDQKDQKDLLHLQDQKDL
jgi:hypothetical protein